MSTTSTTSTVFTLPPHLRASLSDLAGARILPETIQREVDAALAQEVVREDIAEVRAAREILAGPRSEAKKDEKAEKDEKSEKDEKGDEEDTGEKEVPAEEAPERPPTVPAALLDEIASWAANNNTVLTAAGLDSGDYGAIALLAGAEVYLPPRQRALAVVAERTSKEPNPFLPHHLSPAPPREIRNTLDMLGKVLNVLFSIFGAGGAAYAAATSGGGWERGRAMALAVVVGAGVGVADLGLLWIYGRRKREKRAREARVLARESRGSGKVEEKLLIDEGEDPALVDECLGEDASTEVPDDIIPPPAPKSNIRLRRRGL